MSTALAAYTTSEADGFSIETNSPGDPMPESTDAGVTETDEPTPEPATGRDERGRFAAKAAEHEPEATDEQADEKPDQPQKPPKRSLSRMIWEREESERKAKAAEERAARLEAELAEARKSRPEARPSPARQDARPDVGEKFTYQPFDAWLEANPDGSYEDYIDERAVARIEHKRAADERERTARESVERLRTWGAAHQAREIDARRRFADYDQRLTETQAALTAAGFASLPPALGRAILESERSADLAYHLATHPEVALQLAQEAHGLPESAAPVMRRFLESRLSAASSGPAEQLKVTSSAKPVIKPVTGTPAATDADDEPDETEDLDRYIARENARARKAGRW